MEPETIQLDFWNVGQGDASTITWPDGTVTVIDCGPKNNSLVNFLTHKQPHINNIFITHNDDDHIGGFYSLIRQIHDKIDSVKMIDDRDHHNFKKILGTLSNANPQFINTKISRLECQCNQPSQLFQYNDYTVEICYPNFIANVQSSKPNDTSAILWLKYQNDIIVVWGADNSLKNIASNCSSSVQLLFGPHHGAPKEWKNTNVMTKHLQNISPSQCFLSFATINGHDHPCPKYIEALRKIGCSITCAQLAKKCAGGRTTPVFNGDGLFGQKVPAKRNQVSCHGHTRIFVQGRDINDEYANEYRNAVKLLSKALCNKV